MWQEFANESAVKKVALSGSRCASDGDPLHNSRLTERHRSSFRRGPNERPAADRESAAGPCAFASGAVRMAPGSRQPAPIIASLRLIPVFG